MIRVIRADIIVVVVQILPSTSILHPQIPSVIDGLAAVIDCWVCRPSAERITQGGAVGTILKHSRYADNKQAKNRGLDRDGLLARHSAAVMGVYWSVGRVPQNGRGNEKQSMAIPARLALEWRLCPVIS